MIEVPDNLPEWPTTAYRQMHEALAVLHHTVRQERQRRQLTLRELAAQTGLNLNSLSRFERGRSGLQLASALALLRWLAQPAREVP